MARGHSKKLLDDSTDFETESRDERVGSSHSATVFVDHRSNFEVTGMVRAETIGEHALDLGAGSTGRQSEIVAAPTSTPSVELAVGAGGAGTLATASIGTVEQLAADGQSFVQIAMDIAPTPEGFPSVHKNTTQAGQQITRDNYHWGSTLGQPAGPITFGFRTSAPGYAVSGENVQGTFTPLSAAEQAAARAALGLWASVANITFTDLGNSNSATIEFANYYSSTDQSEAFAFYPVPPADTSAGGYMGDVFVNTYYASTTNDNPGTYEFMTFIHEIGHALGLEHPGSYNAGPGQTITYANNAEYIEDTRMYTLMSYFSETNTGGSYSVYDETPMLDDIAAIQRLYGANTGTRTGNTTYGFNSNAGSPFSITSGSQFVVFTAWDQGGTDTFDFSGYSQSQVIDLNAEHFSSVGGNIYNVCIGLGVTIENAVGGSAGDTMTGNGADNRLTGLGGNDSIDGGSGTDSAVFSGLRSAYTLTDLGGGSVRVSGPDGTDTLASVERLVFSDQTITWPPSSGSGVDLTSSILSLTQGGTDGRTITISHRVSNIGTATGNGGTSGIYISSDATIATSDQLYSLGMSILNPMAPGSSVDSQPQTFTLGAEIGPGTYWIGTIADYQNQVAESNDTNNASTGFQITIQTHDDYADNLSDATSPLGQVSVGGSATGNLEVLGDHDWFQAQLTSGITYVIQMQGSGHGAGTLYDPYLRVYNGSSVLQTSNDDSGGNLDSYLTFTPSASGTYYIDAAAYSDFYTGTYRVSLASIQPDLDLYDNMTASATTVAPGGGTTLSYYVVNFGNAAVGASTTGFYLSTDANITTSDTLLGTRSAPALTAYGGATWYDFETQTVTLPGNLAVGTYYLGAIADYNNAITTELTESNNASNAVQIAVQRPDLDLYDNMTVSNAVVGAGGSTTLSYYVVNFAQAAVGASTTGFYLSTDANITTADTLLTTRSAPALTGYGGAMWYDFESQTVTLPGNLAPGTYYLGAISDYSNAITESDESNNASNAVQVTIPQPDLDLYDNMTVSNAVVGAGGSTTLSYYVVNNGLAAVGASTTGFYLSTDANITTSDTLLTTRSAPALTGYGGAMWYDFESQTVTLPGNLAPGTYYLGAIADYNNVVTNEITEANNASNAVQVTIPQPDLDLYDNMTVSDAVVGAGGSTTLSYYVVNFGLAAVGASTTGFYLSTDANITTADTLLTTRSAPALTANGGAMWYDFETQTVTLPSNLAVGTYYLGAISDYTNAITESDESNNASNAVQIAVQRPDLDLYDNMTVSNAVVGAGGSTTLSYYVVNFGLAAVGASTTGFYLSTDANITTADTLLTTRSAPALTGYGGAMWYDYESQTVTLPGNLAPGTYYLGAISDYANAITESDESNNASNAVQVTIPQPDLDLYDNMTASVTTLAAGASTTLSYYVVNFGLAAVGASTTGFYLSTDANITTGDTLLTTRSAPALTANGGAMWYDYESQTVTLPGNLTPGTYYLGAIADYNNVVTNEITEANNASNAVQITIGQADLDLYDNVTVSSATVAAGGSTTLSYYVVNFSDAAVGASTTGFYLSTDANITTSDTLLTTRSAPALTANGGAMWYDYESQTVVLPGNLASGTYYLGAIADYSNAITESDEVNNASNAVQITVTSTMVSSQDFGFFNDSLSVGNIGASSASSLTGWQDVDATALGNSWLQDPASSGGSLLGPVNTGYVDGQGQPDLSQFVTADAAGAQFRPQPVL